MIIISVLGNLHSSLLSLSNSYTIVVHIFYNQWCCLSNFVLNILYLRIIHRVCMTNTANWPSSVRVQLQTDQHHWPLWTARLLQQIDRIQSTTDVGLHMYSFYTSVPPDVCLLGLTYGSTFTPTWQNAAKALYWRNRRQYLKVLQLFYAIVLFCFIFYFVNIDRINTRSPSSTTNT